MIQPRLVEAHTTWEYYCNKYYDTCFKKGTKADFMHLFNLFLYFVFPAYKGVPFDDDVTSKNQHYFKYYIECMLMLWEKYETLPKVKQDNIRFESCVTALVRMLSEGFEISVYTVGSDPKPKRYGALTTEETKRCTRHDIVMIPRHMALFLVSESDVNMRLHGKGIKKTKGSKTRTPRGKASPISRQQKPFNSVIPANKTFKGLVQQIIALAKNIDEVTEYSLENIYPKCREISRLYHGEGLIKK